MKRRFFYIIVIPIVIMLAFSTGCGEIEFLTSPPDDAEEEESLFIDDPSFFLYKSGNKDKTVTADEGRLYEDKQRLQLRKARIEYFENGNFVAELTAEKGVLFLESVKSMNRQKHDAVLTGDVIYRNVDGAILKTQKLVWDNDKEKIFSQSRFYMEMPRGDTLIILEGKRFETDKTLSKWKDEGASIRKIPLNS